MGKRELHYFDDNYERSIRWYRSWFPLGQGPVFESTPSYLCTPGVAPRAGAVLPDARLIAVLRHPAVRATSHFAWRRSRGGEDAPDLPTAMDQEPERLASGQTLGCYALHSRYEVGLQAWLAAFSTDQLCVVIAERLFAGDPGEIGRVGSFLGLEEMPSVPRSNAGPGGESVRPEVAAALAPTIDAVEDLIGRATGWVRPGRR